MNRFNKFLNAAFFGTFILGTIAYVCSELEVNVNEHGPMIVTGAVLVFMLLFAVKEVSTIHGA